MPRTKRTMVLSDLQVATAKFPAPNKYNPKRVLGDPEKMKEASMTRKKYGQHVKEEKEREKMIKGLLKEHRDAKLEKTKYDPKLSHLMK